MKKPFAMIVGAIFVGMLAGGPVRAVGDDEAALDSLRCKSAGVGLEERQTRPKGFQARLIFANPKGEYFANVRVRIRKGKAERTVRCDGPWVFLKGMPGEYVVVARVGEAKAAKRIMLPEKGMKNYLFHLK